MSTVNQKRNVELMIIDKQLDLCYQGYCKLTINKPSKHLVIEPYNEDCKLVSASFNQIYIQQNNVLCIFSKDYNNDAVLMFRKSNACKRVYDIIMKNRTDTIDDIDTMPNLVKERFLTPLLKNFEKTTNENIKNCILKNMDFFKGNEEYMQILAATDFDMSLFSTVPNLSNNERSLRGLEENDATKLNRTENTCNRKRKFKEIILSPISPLNKIIEKPNYQIHECGITSKPRLIIFSDKEKKLCYEYYWGKKQKAFYCCSCILESKSVRAWIFEDDKNGKEFIETGKKVHMCLPRSVPKKNAKRRLMKNYVHLKRNIEEKSKIVQKEPQFRKKVTATKSKESESKKTPSKRSKPNETTKPVKDLTYKIPYDEAKIILEADKFELKETINTIGNKSLRIFIFTSEDQKFCYEFSEAIHHGDNMFICLGCHSMPKKKDKEASHLKLKLCQHDNGEYYVRMKDNKHLCQPREYAPEIYAIIKNLDFMFFTEGNETLKLMVKRVADKNVCYTYKYKKASKTFYCIDCKKLKQCPSAKIYCEDDGKEYIRLGPKMHLCNGIKYSQFLKKKIKILEKSGITIEKKKPKEDESKIVKYGDFEFRSNNIGNLDHVVIIFFPENKKLCYKLHYNPHNKLYECLKCKHVKKLTVTARLLTDENGQKYLRYGKNEHQCEPQECQKVIYPPEYMIINPAATDTTKKLIIFTSPDRKMCYQLSYVPGCHIFTCHPCRYQKTHVMGKYFKYENGNEYVELGKYEHVCSPKVFNINDYKKEPPHEMKTSTNFLLQYNTFGNFGKLFLFNSSDKTIGYEFHSKDTRYYCLGCKTKAKRWTLKLLSNENGEKYVKYKDIPHECTIKNFLELGRIIYSPNFKIEATENGQKSITVFDPKKKSMRYKFEYNIEANTYFCNGCKIRERYISAIICKNENDEDYLVINAAHSCGGVE